MSLSTLVLWLFDVENIRRQNQWLQHMVTMFATDVPGGMTRVARKFGRTCPADNSTSMF